MGKRIRIAALVALVAAGGLWLYRHFSPYQICLRVNTQQALDAGQSTAQAADYARGLCTAKMPLQR